MKRAEESILVEKRALHLFCLFCGSPLIGKSLILIPFLLIGFWIWRWRDSAWRQLKEAFRKVPELGFLFFFLGGYGVFSLIGFLRMPGSQFTGIDGPLYVVVFLLLFLAGFFVGIGIADISVRECVNCLLAWSQIWGSLVAVNRLLMVYGLPYWGHGIVGDINPLASFFLIMTPLALMSVFWGENTSFRVIGFVSFCFFTIVLFKSTTSDVRYVFWILGVMLVYFFYRSKTIHIVPFVLLLLLGVLLIMNSQAISSHLKDIDLLQKPFGEGSVPYFQKILCYRDAIWQGSLRVLGRNYWFGVGPGNFHKTVYPYLVSLKDYFGFDPDFWHAHNIFLHVFVTTGIWGGIFFLFSVLVQIRIATRLLVDEVMWPIGLGISIVLLNIYLYGLFEPVVDSLLAILWGGLGFAVAHLAEPRTP